MNSDLFLIDTNIFVFLFKNCLAEPLPDGEIACSIITEMELLSWELPSSDEVLIHRMLAGVTIYNIDQNVKEEAVRLRRESGLELSDAIIASTAICHHAVLLTNDNDFKKVSSLRSYGLAVKQ